MKKKFKLGVIGAGFMATAIIKGAIAGKVINASEIIVSDVNQISLDKISKIGVEVTMNNVELVDQAEYVLFAVKPQNLNELLIDIKSCLSNLKFISIMAGVKKEKFKKVFPNSKIARCMPNTPCSIGAGAVGLDASDFTDKNDVDFINALLSSFGTVVEVEEDKLGAVTGVSGSSPAYFYLFLKGVIDAGVSQGLSYEQARLLATSTMIGAGKMVEKNPEKSLDELINAVCSKGGTTIEAIKVYQNNDINKITKEALDACVKRSQELENL